MQRALSNVLGYTFNKLSTAEKGIFLDVATVYNGMPMKVLIRIWQRLYRRDAAISVAACLRTLERRCLLERVDDTAGMHDVLKYLGRNVLFTESTTVVESASAQQFAGSRLFVCNNPNMASKAESSVKPWQRNVSKPNPLKVLGAVKVSDDSSLCRACQKTDMLGHCCRSRPATMCPDVRCRHAPCADRVLFLTRWLCMLTMARLPADPAHVLPGLCSPMCQGRRPVAVQLDADSVFAAGSSPAPPLPEQPDPPVDLSKARVLRIGRARPESVDPTQVLLLDVAAGAGVLPWQLPAQENVTVIVDIPYNKVRATDLLFMVIATELCMLGTAVSVTDIGDHCVSLTDWVRTGLSMDLCCNTMNAESVTGMSA